MLGVDQLNIGTAGIVVAAFAWVSSALTASPWSPSVAGSGVPPTPVAAGPGVVVVNEFVPGAYVELHNTSKSTVDVSGFGLWLCDAGSAATEVRIAFGQTLSPGGFYVVASSSFTGAPVDQIYWDVLPGDGAMLLDPDHGWADGVAVAAGSPCGEEAPAPECGQGSTARDAVSADSGSNAADFACRARSPGEPNP
jgi:hypothetical protein